MGAETEKSSKKKTKRARLGRGLSALVDNTPVTSIDLDTDRSDTDQLPKITPTVGAITPDAGHERVLEIPLGQIAPNPHQPRRDFDEEALESLAQSIRTHGVMQPIVVRVSGSGGGYELIAGERRLRAAKLAGLSKIRCVLDEADDARSAELALIENIQRADLNPIERALGLRELLDRFGSTQQQLADRMGMSRSGLANSLRLLDLSDEIRAMISGGRLSMGHAKVLLSCDNEEARTELASRCAQENWSVRELETRCAILDAKPKTERSDSSRPESTTPDRVSSVLRDLEKQLSEQLGTRVTLRTNLKGNKGRIQIEFFDLDQFDGLLARMGISSDLG